MSNLASSMMNEKAQPQAPAPAYPGPPPNAPNPAQPQSPYVPPAQTLPQQYPGQQPPQGQYYSQQYPAGQYPAVQPQFYPTAGVYAQGSIGPQSGFQTAPAQTVYVMGPGAQYQQQSASTVFFFTLCFRRLNVGSHSHFCSVHDVRERQPRCGDEVWHGGHSHSCLLLPDRSPCPPVRIPYAHPGAVHSLTVVVLIEWIRSADASVAAPLSTYRRWLP